MIHYEYDPKHSGLYLESYAEARLDAMMKIVKERLANMRAGLA